MRAVEAESARLFADKYVAMRDSFLKGVCAFSDDMGLDAGSVIAGLGLGSGAGPRSKEGPQRQALG